jgi:glycosyltransferase involved in cell wall biosynthesis
MKICIFTETYYPVVGGGETQAQLLAEGLIANGHSVTILTRRSDASLKRHEKYGNINVYRLSPVGSGQLKKWGLLLSSLFLLIKLRNQYDLIFVSGYRIIGLTAVLVGKIFRKLVVLKADSQGEMSGEFFESGLRKFGTSRSSLPFRLFLGFRNAVLKMANVFSAISPEIVSELTSSGVPANKIHLIPNSVDTNRFVPVDAEQKSILRKKLNLSQDATIAIYTGRLVSYKGLPLLLSVWNEIRNKHENVILILAGTGGLDIHNCEDELRGYVRSSSLEQSVLFTGAVQNVYEYLQAADIFTFPSTNDAFPSSLIEAMACALPVIATPVGAIKTIISNGENGLLVKPGDFLQLFEALDILLSDKVLSFRLGQAAWQTVQEQYSAENVMNKYIALFKSSLFGNPISQMSREKSFMKKRKFMFTVLVVICLMIGFAGGIFVVMKRGIPFVTEREQWTIGIYEGKSPFSFDSFQFRWEPVFRAEDVTDVSAKFVADPFLIKEGATWYLFFEVYDNATQQGDEAVATSTDTRTWKYQQVILDEPFHLSFPYVFKWQNDYYMIPESYQANSVRLYKAVDFPTKWSFVKTLVEGRDYVDNTIVYFNGKWWLFSCVTSNDTLYLFYADDLLGPWTEHPQSPIVQGNTHKARPSGRLLVYNNKLYRYTMDVNPPFGTHQIFAYEITEITPSSYSEKLVKEEPIFKPSGSGWNAQAMHQIDPVQVAPDDWITSVDGFGKYLIFGWQY